MQQKVNKLTPVVYSRQLEVGFDQPHLQCFLIRLAPVLRKDAERALPSGERPDVTFGMLLSGTERTLTLEIADQAGGFESGKYRFISLAFVPLPSAELALSNTDSCWWRRLRCSLRPSPPELQSYPVCGHTPALGHKPSMPQFVFPSLKIVKHFQLESSSAIARCLLRIFV
jgi:hypothetical protein